MSFTATSLSANTSLQRKCTPARSRILIVTRETRNRIANKERSLFTNDRAIGANIHSIHSRIGNLVEGISVIYENDISISLIDPTVWQQMEHLDTEVGFPCIVVDVLGVLYRHGLVDTLNNDNGFDAAVHQFPKSLRPMLDVFPIVFLTW